jgi:DNA-binding CsgD family transcriptional regulator
LVFPERVSIPIMETMDLVQPRPLPPPLNGTPVLSEPLVPQDRRAVVIPLRRRQKPLSGLSERELQVLELTAEGLTNAEIGEVLFLSEETIKSHLGNLLAKLQARSKAHAVALGFRLRLIA